MDTIIKLFHRDGDAATVEICEANGARKISGTASGTTANKLVYATGGFTAAVDVGDEVWNVTDNTFAIVTAKDSDTQLSLSADIFVSSEQFAIQGEFTHNITDSDMGSTDAANLDPVANPVVAGDNTFEKYQKVHVTAMGGSSAIDNLKVWRTTALGGSATHVTNARTSSYDRKEYVAPTASDSTVATQAMPTSEPGSANLGIEGSLSGSLTAAGYSDFLVHQIQTDAGDTAGATTTMHYQYDETA